MMTTNRSLIAALVATVAVVTALAFPAVAALRPQATSTAAAGTLTTTQLVAMYEEERLAGDVYDTFADQYGTRIFTNIAHAEGVHQGAVTSLLESSGFDLGTLPTQPGDYSTDGYADLYRQLVAEGGAGLASAYEVGVGIETRDIADLDRLLASTTDAHQTSVLTALRTGSQHHLAAFSGGEQGTSAGRGAGSGRMGSHQDGQDDQDGAGDCDGSGLTPGHDRESRGHGHHGEGHGMEMGAGSSA